MPNEPKKPLIVISYAHADEPERPAEGEVKWLSFVTGYLKPAIKHGAVDLWLDRLMPGGTDWEREIEQKLRACDIFILLVSRHSLSSDYVVDKEIKIIRERQAKGEAVHFYPLILTPTPKAGLDLVRDKNLRPRDGKPLSDYPLHERYRHMSDAADEIAEIARKCPSLGKYLAKAPRQSRLIDGPEASINSPTPRSRFSLHIEAGIKDRDSLELWARNQNFDFAIALAG
ncbi:MAG TPA: toll/interleukin-1 receptor domain-containing protein, partial [Roseiarcus sp.]|nr:toll/interleukin-1 receptor domain-containing protein [Roseiarcus sp.]